MSPASSSSSHHCFQRFYWRDFKITSFWISAGKCFRQWENYFVIGAKAKYVPSQVLPPPKGCHEVGVEQLPASADARPSLNEGWGLALLGGGHGAWRGWVVCDSPSNASPDVSESSLQWMGRKDEIAFEPCPSKAIRTVSFLIFLWRKAASRLLRCQEVSWPLLIPEENVPE